MKPTSRKKIAFSSPIAKEITGLWVDETKDFRMGVEVKQLKVLEIKY
ncbi:MAG: hypothetical protein AB8H12_24770 [Lewinella sp.]